MYEQYKAIVALSELVGNPKALKEAAETMSKSIALNEQEIAKRNEYNDTINNTNKALAELAKKRSELDSLNVEYVNNVEILAADRASFESQSSTRESAILSRESKCKEKESSLNTREGNLSQRESHLDVRDAATSAKESALNARDFDVTEREKKISAIVSAGK